MKLRILPIGKIRSKPICEIASDYAARIKHYCACDVHPCKNDREALSAIKSGDVLVLLDAAGEEYTSEGLAKFVAEHQMRGTKRLVFFLGAAEGPSDAIKARADVRLSLSRLTFPHELAQAMLLEQLYRSFTILKGEPYHK